MGKRFRSHEKSRLRGDGIALDVPTAYFFAGGRARSPSLNEDAYSWFFLTRFSWTDVAIAN